MEGNPQVAKFLQALHPGGPWLLAAIEPDGAIVVQTFKKVAEAQAFVARYEGSRNLHYCPSTTKLATNKKPTKADIATVEYLFTDHDPRPNETPAEAKTRILAAVEAFGLRPSILVDSGNGLQCLWRLDQAIPTTDDSVVGELEGRMRAMLLLLGAAPGTQNIDRLLRLPGTTNLPNKTKRAKGYVDCDARLLWAESTSYALNQFPEPDSKRPRFKRSSKSTNKPEGDTHPQEPDVVVEDELTRTIRDGGEHRHGNTRSEAVWWTVNEMLRRGYQDARIVRVLLDERNGISAHVLDQHNPQDYAGKQVDKAKEDITLATYTTKQGQTVVASPENINIALAKAGYLLSYDQFGNRITLQGLSGCGANLEDYAVTRIGLQLTRMFGLNVTEKMLFKILLDNARVNTFHPVHDYLNGLTWDGVKRIDRLLVDYFGTASSDYHSAVGRLMMIGGVRRVLQPGVKFDEMAVLENPEQGTNKSTALRILATRDEWFTDDLPLSVSGKVAIELLSGKWVIEIAELAKLKQAEIEHVKSLLSRQYDRGRLVWDKLTTDMPRQCVFWGTTNESKYLKDRTGNRRFWPFRCGVIDIAALKRDVDQLWAEAKHLEAQGEPIRLAPKLWPAATAQQEQRVIADPYRDILDSVLEEHEGKIEMTTLFEILGLKGSQLYPEQNKRIADAMRSLGWERNEGGTITTNGRKCAGFHKGDRPWKWLCLTRGFNGEMEIIEGSNKQGDD
jgi:hypothetical protein